MGFSTTKLKLPKIPKDIGKTFYTPEVMELVIELHIVFQDRKNSYEKMSSWMTTKNMNLGNVAPFEMVIQGKSKRLLEAAQALIRGNMP